MSSSYCCSWPAYRFLKRHQNFPQFVVVHTIKGFGIVNKAEIDVFFWNSLAFLMIQWMFGNLISGSSAFSKSSLNLWKFTDHVLLKPFLENFERYFAIMLDGCNCVVVWAFFVIAFLWVWNENWQSCDQCWVFQICWHFELSTFTESSFRIWNSSTGIPSPPLALFIVMLTPKCPWYLFDPDQNYLAWIR